MAEVRARLAAQFPIYAWPSGVRHELARPLLASWDAAVSPAQVRLERYRRELKTALGSVLSPDSREPLALGLAVALPPGSGGQ